MTGDVVVVVVGDVVDVAEVVAAADVVVVLPLVQVSHRWSWCPVQTLDVFVGIPSRSGLPLIVGQNLKKKKKIELILSKWRFVGKFNAKLG